MRIVTKISKRTPEKIFQWTTSNIALFLWVLIVPTVLNTPILATTIPLAPSESPSHHLERRGFRSLGFKSWGIQTPQTPYHSAIFIYDFIDMRTEVEADGLTSVEDSLAHFKRAFTVIQSHMTYTATGDKWGPGTILFSVRSLPKTYCLGRLREWK